MDVALCPDRGQLESYALGKLGPEELDLIADHLLGCPSCDSAVEGLENVSDSLAAELRSPPLEDDLEHEPALRQTLEVLRARFNQVEVPLSAHPAVPATRLAGTTVVPDNDLGNVREYRLLEKIGQGGMGTVYKAVHSRLKRVVAVKLLPEERMHDEASVRRFAREMEAVGKLEHSHIVKALDAGEDDGRHFLVMEYVKGFDLARLSKHCGPIAVADACELVRQAAVGLQHAHEHGLVHRDVKPSNLLLASDGQVKVLDLGLARLHGDRLVSDELTATGQIMGTRHYMAPEQFDDTRSVDIRADVYGLGATLETLITGEVPPIRPHQHPVLEPLTPVLDRMLARDPAERFATPAEVAEALALFAAGADLTTLLRRADGVERSEHGGGVAGLKRSDGVAGSEQRDGPGEALRDQVGAKGSPSPLRGGGPGWGGRPQRGRRRPRFVAVATGVFALAALAAAAFVVRLATDHGELVIESPDPGIEIVLKRAGEFYDGLELQSGENRTTLQAGEYEVQIVGNTDGLNVEDNKFTLTRGGEAVVTIRREAVTPQQTEEQLYEGKTFSEWQEVLKTEISAERRAKAVQALGLLGKGDRGKEAARAILRAMRGVMFGNHDDHEVIRLTQPALGAFIWPQRIDPAAATPVLIEELQTGNDNSQAFATHVMTYPPYRSATAAIPPLLDLTNHPNPQVRKWVIGTLGSMRPVRKETLIAIREATRDPNEEVRQVAAGSLERIHRRGERSKNQAEDSPGTSTTEESLYEGKTFSEWQEVLQTERSPERLAVAVRALGALATGDRSEQVASAILQAMRVSTLGSGDIKEQQLVNAGIGAFRRQIPKEAAIPVLIDELKNGNESSRAFAALILTYSQYEEATAAVPALLSLSKDPNAKVREMVVRALADISPVGDKALQVIREAVQDPERDVRRAAENALRRLMPEQFPPQDRQSAFGRPEYNGKTFSQWLSLLKTERNPERIMEAPEALVILSQNGHEEEAVKSILEATRFQQTWNPQRSEEFKFGRVAKSVLRNLESSVRIPALIEELKQGNANSQTFACDLLQSAYKDPAAKDAIPELFDLTRSESPEVRDEAIYALFAINRAAEGFEDRLRKRLHELLHDENPSVLATAIRLTHRIDPEHKEIISALVRLCTLVDPSSNGPLGDHNANSLFRLLGEKAQEAVPGLIEALKNDDPNVRRRVLYALAEIQPVGEAAIAALKQAMQDEDASVRKSATFLYEQQQSPHAGSRRNRARSR